MASSPKVEEDLAATKSNSQHSNSNGDCDSGIEECTGKETAASSDDLKKDLPAVDDDHGTIFTVVKVASAVGASHARPSTVIDDAQNNEADQCTKNGSGFYVESPDDQMNIFPPDGASVYQSSLSINDFPGYYQFKNDDVVADHLPIPPDGGYGWVIVACAFVCNFFVDGVANSFGPFMSAYQTAFSATKASTSVIGSLLIGVYLLSGPVAGGLLNNYETRRVVIAGTLLASVAFILSTFSPNIFVHYVLYGLFGGIGFGFIYLPAIVSVSQYFEARRALATGIAVSGSGFGTFVMPILSKYLIEAFGWKVALYVIASLILSCALCGLLFRPLPVMGFDVEQQAQLDELQKQQALLAALSRADETIDNEECNSNTTGGPGGISPHPLRSTRRTESECTSGVPGQADDGQPLLDLPSDGTDAEAREDESGTPPPTPYRPQLSPINEHRRLSKSRAGSQIHHAYPHPPPVVRTRKHTLTSMNSEFTSIAGGMDTSNGQLRYSRPNLNSQLSRVSARSYAQSLSRISVQPSIRAGESVMSVAMSGVDPKEFARPMSRHDIFLQGSIKNLKEFEGEGNNFRAYRQSQISIPVAVAAQAQNAAPSICMSQVGGGGAGAGDIADLTSRLGGSQYSRVGGLTGPEDEWLPMVDDSKFKWIPLPIRLALSEMIDLTLLREPIMLLLCASNIFGMLGFYVPFVFIIDLAIARSASPSEATLLLSVIGFSNTFGRVFFGWMADRRWVTALGLSNWSLLTCGILTVLCPLVPNYLGLIIYAALFGFVVAAYVCLTSIVLSDLLGVERLTNSFGLLVVSRGIASLIGTPIAGIVYDFTTSYDATFYFAGGLIILSGLTSIAIGPLHRYERSLLKNEGDYPGHQLDKDPDVQSGKLSVLTEHSEENLTEYQRTIQSIGQQRQLILELEEFKRRGETVTETEEIDHPTESTGDSDDNHLSNSNKQSTTGGEQSSEHHA